MLKWGATVPQCPSATDMAKCHHKCHHKNAHAIVPQCPTALMPLIWPSAITCPGNHDAISNQYSAQKVWHQCLTLNAKTSSAIYGHPHGRCHVGTNNNNLGHQNFRIDLTLTTPVSDCPVTGPARCFKVKCANSVPRPWHSALIGPRDQRECDLTQTAHPTQQTR